MHSSIPEGWSEFGVAAAGATAALAGLLFVAISVNVKEILADEIVVRRAASTVGSLVLGVVVSLALLIPQSLLALGIEVLVAAAISAIIEVRALIPDLTQVPRRPVREGESQVSLALIQWGPLFVAGALLAASLPIGLYFLAGGVATVVIGAIVNAWVLLIEILR